MWASLGTGPEPACPREGSCGARTRFCVLAAGVAVAFFLLGFLIGWLANRHGHQLPRTDVHEKTKAAFMKEMKAESIKEILYNFTRHPHLAGTKENLHLAEQIQASWKAFGLDSVELTPYDVLLSYPNETSPNYISLVDEHGQEIFNTSLSEPVPAGYETVKDIVPPYSAFSSQGEPEGDLVYVNYGRIEDFHRLEREMEINCSGKIVIVRYGKIFRGNKIKNAYLAGAKGIILYSDPADSCAPGVQPYPDGWNLPGGGAQRGNILLLDGAGDPLTPGYPAKEYAYRLDEAQSAANLNILVHPIGYHDAEKLLKDMGGAPAPDDSWKGGLSVPYNVGPGFTGTSSKRKVRMHIYSFKQVRRIYNVIGILRGATEPDRYVILGGHRDSWVFGGIDPQSGAAVVHEIVRSFGKLKHEAQQRMLFLSQLGKLRLPKELLTQFYRGIIESIICTSITVWFGNATKQEKYRLQRIIRTAEKIIATKLPSIEDLYTEQSKKRAGKIIMDPSHPEHNLFQLLPSGCRYRTLQTKTTRHKDSFFPHVINLLNS